MKTLPMGLVIAFISVAVLGVSGCETAQQRKARLKEEAEIPSIKCAPERQTKKINKFARGKDIFVVTTAPTAGSSSSTWSFAHSSGTSGCGEKETAYIQQHHFVAATIENLSEQIAQGGGPHLQSLSTLLGCPASDYSKLAAITRQNYGQLFPSAETEPEVFLTRLKDKMRDNPILAGNCVYI